jgi:hypothetical protein
LWEWTDSLGIRSLSYGGVAAPNDFWAFEDNDSVAGLVLLASRLRQDTCAEIDFSNTNCPMANVQASLDGIIKPAWMASSSQLGWHHQQGSCCQCHGVVSLKTTRFILTSLGATMLSLELTMLPSGLPSCFKMTETLSFQTVMCSDK